MNSIKKTPPVKAHGEYVKEIKTFLPKEAFYPAPNKLFSMLIYFISLASGFFLFRLTSNLFFYFLLSCLIAHCLSCIGFLSHELSHHAILKNKKFRYPLEVLSWGLNLIPATVWDRTHNHTHHTQTNTLKDPDRQYLFVEKTAGTNLYTKLFYPNKKVIKWNPLVAFHFIPYIVRNIISCFYKDGSKPDLVPFKPRYSAKQKTCIIIELLIIMLLQFAIFSIVQRNIIAYLFAGPLSYLFTSAILMTYIFTNHFLNPITEHNDPLLGTTTVEVPAIINRLHFNFAFHTEHHLFPSMNSKFYPELSKILREKYPDRYHYLRLKDAWIQLWLNEDFISVSKENPIKD